MGALFYMIGLKLYELLARITALFNPKAKEFIVGRKQVWDSLNKQLINITDPILWVHCSSVGEYEQGRPVMESYKTHYPDHKILVTFYSPSGYAAVKTDKVVDFISYLPFDSRRNSKQFMELVKPKLAFFVKYEFWYFYLKELKTMQVPTYSISSIFRSEQLFFKWYGAFYRKLLNYFDFFFVQDTPSQLLLNKLNLPNTVTGDTRLDRVLKIREQKMPLPEIEDFATNNMVMVVGSLRKEDVDIIIDFINQHPKIKFIVAPHEINEGMIQPLEQRIDSTIRHSRANSNIQEQVLIIDNIGMLSQLYRYANFAYVGGGFSDGLHNILEPAVYEIPVFFGNKDYQRFKEAIDLIDLGVAFPIGSIAELDAVFDHLAGDVKQQAYIKNSLSSYLEENKGASEKIIYHITKDIG